MKSKNPSQSKMKKVLNKQERLPTNEEPLNTEEQKQNELENLNKNLMKKLYFDLFAKNSTLYQDEDLSFENFIFKFYTLIEDTIDYTNPNYPLLLQKVDLKIKAKLKEENTLLPSMTKTEIKKELNKLSQEDEWSLIYKYKLALYEEEVKREKEEKAEKLKKYHDDLTTQIDIKKNFVDETAKAKAEMYNYDKKEKEEQLENMKIENQIMVEKLKDKFKNNPQIKDGYIKTLEDENLKLNEQNKMIVRFKLEYLMSMGDDNNTPDPLLTELVDMIMNETKLEKINKLLNCQKYKRVLDQQMEHKVKCTNRPDKMSVEERKINKELLEKSKAYFRNKKLLNK